MSGREPLETRPPRMDALARLPVFFALQGKRALVAGNNAGAAWKAELLAAAGADVEIFAPEPGEEMLAVVTDTMILRRRRWAAEDFAGAAIAVGGCETDEEAAEFAAAARAAGVPVNVIDRPAFCDFSFGAIVNRSPLVVGISTDGAAPVFAQAIRGKIEAMLPLGFARWAQAAARWRSALKLSDLSFAARRTFWQLFTARALTSPEREPAQSDLDALMAEVKGLGGAAEAGSVTLVGAGPGDPELLTLRAVRALQSADVILFDDLVSRDVLDFARREAKKMLVGKTGHAASCKQDDINALMVSLARQGKRVVRLKGGDPLIFARATEELDACRAATIKVEVVPGITAAQGAAARLGIPLTGRGEARRLQYITGHDRKGGLPADIDWRAIADQATTTAIYMPVRTLSSLVEQAIARGLDPFTPAAAIIRATRPDQETIAAPICELPGLLAQSDPKGPVLVMLGRVLGNLAGAAEAESERAPGVKS